MTDNNIAVVYVNIKYSLRHFRSQNALRRRRRQTTTCETQTFQLCLVFCLSNEEAGLGCCTKDAPAATRLFVDTMIAELAKNFSKALANMKTYAMTWLQQQNIGRDCRCQRTVDDLSLLMSSCLRFFRKSAGEVIFSRTFQLQTITE